MLLSVVACVAAFVALVWLLRSSQVSLGLPIAYLGSLLLIHVPGAVAHILDANHVLPWPEFTKVGIAFTAVASACFVAGVAVIHFHRPAPTPVPTNRSLFNRFCLLGGWTTMMVPFVVRLPSISAVVSNGGAIWMLGILLALRSAQRRGDPRVAVPWILALLVYPTLMLLLGGFMSYGVASAIVVMSAMMIPVRSRWRVTLATCLAVVAGISIFLAYFEHRSDIRSAVWGGADVDTRVGVSVSAFKDIGLFDPRNPLHLQALDARLNQNYFVGLAAARIASNKVDYLRGRSLWEGFLALVPRALWPEKPVIAGSPQLVAEMTGLKLSKGTSFGVGNVMEFQINFGIPGLIVGFFLLGLLIGYLDRAAATADMRGELGKIFPFFLPAVALIQPNGSIVEMVGGSAAALAAAYGWVWAWDRWSKRRSSHALAINRTQSPLVS